MPDKRSFDLALEYVVTEGAEGAHPARLPTTRGAP
jgi:hypothetical protein